MVKKYYSLNTVPIGTKMVVNITKEEVELVEIQNFPTTFITQSEDGSTHKYLTHQVKIIGWPENSE